MAITDAIDQARRVKKGRDLAKRLLDIESDLDPFLILPAAAQASAAFAQ
jgi:hypothetical protein